MTNVTGHSGSGEVWGGAVLLLTWGLLILRWWLWTRCYHKMPCGMGQIQWSSAHPHLPLNSHQLQRKSSQFMCQECHAPCKRNLGPTLSDLHRLQCSDWAMIRWLCGVTTKDHVNMPDPLERMLLDDLAKVLGTRRLRWHSRVVRSDGWLNKVQKLNPTRGRSRGRPKKTWTEVVDMDCVALGWTETHPSDSKAWSGRLKVLPDWTHP